MSYFSAYRSFVSLGRFIPRYLILFVAMVNGSVSLISLSDFSSLLYRNARVFCALILYPATLPDYLMSSSNFLVASLWFAVYSIMPSANSDNFMWYFPICILFISFSSLIAISRTSKTMLNKSGKSGHPFLALILEEILSIFHQWEWCLLWVCHIWPILCWGSFPLCPLSGVFLS